MKNFECLQNYTGQNDVEQEDSKIMFAFNKQPLEIETAAMFEGPIAEFGTLQSHSKTENDDDEMLFKFKPSY